MRSDIVYVTSAVRDCVMGDILCNLGGWVAESVGSGPRGEVVGQCSGWVWQHVDTLAMSLIYTAVYQDI